jgi:hypothetical protein
VLTVGPVLFRLIFCFIRHYKLPGSQASSFNSR